MGIVQIIGTLLSGQSDPLGVTVVIQKGGYELKSLEIDSISHEKLTVILTQWLYGKTLQRVEQGWMLVDGILVMVHAPKS